MPGLIPENTLEDILSRTDIIELISGYIPLKRSGRNFKANCPFHHEKTPSFMVSQDRQIYHCFGCGESGNAFKFLMRHERMDFPEAVEMLAKKAGVDLPKNSQAGQQAQSLSAQLYKINEFAVAYYAHNLHSSAGASAKNYLLKRGIKEETIGEFKLGFALDKWDALINQLREKGISIGLLEKAGLALAKDAGGYYDRFRNRIIFPIVDIKSKPAGFGARVLDNSLPKYVNSPETPIYTKGKNLYGLNSAKDAIRQLDYAVIVEGYLDCIMPFQEGLQNIVASQGTALTEDQVRLLKRYTHNVVLVYDGDAAGQLATLRSLDIFVDEGLNVKVVPLPEGFDPDTFIRKNGISNFKEEINRALSLFDYKLKVLKSRYNIKEAEGKAKISSEMLTTINRFTNSVLKSEYLKKLAEHLSVDEGALLEDLGKIKNNRVSSYYPVNADPGKMIAINPVEKLLIKLMLEESGLIDQVRLALEPADFQNELAHKIVSVLFDLASQGKAVNAGTLTQHFGDESILKVVCESAFLPEISSEDKEKVVNDCIQRLKNEKIKFKRLYLHDQIKSAQHSGDEERLSSLMQEFHLLIKKDNFRGGLEE